MCQVYTAVVQNSVIVVNKQKCLKISDLKAAFYFWSSALQAQRLTLVNIQNG